MALDTYANLQTSILDWLARPGDTLVSGAVPDMITLFESEARDRLRTRFNENASSTITTVAGTATAAVPSMFEGARELLLQPGAGVDDQQVLVYKTPENMDNDNPIETTHQRPTFYTIEGTNFRFAPTPDAVYTIRVTYMQGLPALSNSNTTNWLLTNYPDAYLNGSLAVASMYIGHDERMSEWAGLADNSLNRIIMSDQKTRWSGGRLTMRTDVDNP